MIEHRCFHCWCPDDGDEANARAVEARGPHEAASLYAERNHVNNDYAECIDVAVRDAQGLRTRWTVVAVRSTSFVAHDGEAM